MHIWSSVYGQKSKNPKLLYQNNQEFFQKPEDVAIVPGFGSKQSVQQQSLSSWFVLWCLYSVTCDGYGVTCSVGGSVVN